MTKDRQDEIKRMVAEKRYKNTIWRKLENGNLFKFVGMADANWVTLVAGPRGYAMDIESLKANYEQVI